MSITKRTALAALLALSIPSVANGATTPAKCAEDAPCWTWSTMGNHSRGVVLTDGRRVVVRPCRFAQLDRAHGIDWTRTSRLRGDATARKACA